MSQRNEKRAVEMNLQPARFFIFAEGLENPSCVLILANCLRGLEQQVKETFDLAKRSSKGQIKGELVL